MKEMILKTGDSEKIYANWHKEGYDNCLLISHGFLQYKDSQTFSELASRFSLFMDVLSIDLRGHGKSSGVFTYGSKEKLDVSAALDFISGKYAKIFIMGFSLGASASLQAAAGRKDVTGLILVSIPSYFHKIFPKFWTLEAIRTLITSIGSGKKVRGFNLFYKKKDNTAVIREILAPALIIYASHDWLVGNSHVADIKKEAPANVEFIGFEGPQHAEHIFEKNKDEFIYKILKWIKTIVNPFGETGSPAGEKKGVKGYE
ncbi:MAG: alpha/beta fold hydrolase [Candidatus Omnitrophica bacterium]|jgi:pimeloyl-ACP methyl ester carboxylesterase|nr:lysophospholipase [bacterium]MDD4955999.1 alpha/beta fold hydrolase [Candidatus Omnitrophota bacterium]